MTKNAPKILGVKPISDFGTFYVMISSVLVIMGQRFLLRSWCALQHLLVNVIVGCYCYRIGKHNKHLNRQILGLILSSGFG